MTSTILSSTFFLTLLMLVGLFFFIRASTKDRTETMQMTLAQDPASVQRGLQGYFEQRAYQIVEIEPQTNQVTFRGFVRPSTFLAVFLSFLAAVGSGCLALVLAILFPDYAQGFPVLLLLAPAAGVFYWRRAGREEQVLLTVAAATTPLAEPSSPTSQVTVVAHRDELIALKQTLSV